MVAVVAGNDLGLGNTSLGKLGQAWGGQADIGQAGVSQYVNVANGNLVIRDPGQALVFDGTSFNPLGTYNSQGQLQGGNGWVFGFDRSVGGLTGDLDSDGSTIVRTAEDGSTVTYAYDAASGDYVSQDASGTQDRLRWDASSTSWRWTDGATQANESYDAGGRLTGLSNPATGASFTLAWQDGHVTAVTAGDGDSLTLGYDAAGHLSTLSISEVPPGGNAPVVRQQVGYAYDGLGRLVSVTTYLASDSATATTSYTTTFAYDGDSDRLTSMLQGDGTSVAYAYGQDATGSWRVGRITTGTGDDAQTLTLSYGASATSVTDASGNVWTYGYSATGLLTSVVQPTTNGVSAQTTYTYDADGNLTSVTDPSGGMATYRYDPRGNLLSAIDASGTTMTYRYDTNNRMVSQSRYTVAAHGHEGDTDFVPASGEETTHYLYDTAGRLVYRIDPAGTVTRQDWTTQADGTSVLGTTYTWNGAVYTVGQADPTVADLASWERSSSSALAQGQRSDFTYDVRGQLATRTDYASLDADGNGIVDAAASVTRTTYDAFGRLLQAATVRGANRDVVATRSYAYDGMGRLVSSTDSLGNKTSYIYLDDHNTVEIIDAAGLMTLQVRNSAGAIISSTQSAGKPPLAGQVFYDAQGHIVAASDALGDTEFLFYDAAGHNVAIVDPTNHLTVSTYDTSGHLLSTLRYDQAIDTTGWLTDTGPSSLMPVMPTPPARSPNDAIALSIYDTDGRVIATVDPQGTVITTRRDASGNAVGTVTYATPLTSSQVQALGTSPSLADVQAAVVASPGSDQVTTAAFDDQGHELAGIDASGIVTVMTYDGSGRLIHRLTYAQPLTSDQRAGLGDTPSLDDVQALTTRQPYTDKQAFWFYDDAGHVVGSLDESGKADIHAYNGDRLTSTLELGQPLDVYAIENFAAAPTYAALAAMLNTSTDRLTGTLTLYDAAGHVAATVTDSNLATRYTLDADGRILATRTVYIQQASAVANILATPTLATLDDAMSAGYDQGTTRSVYDDNGQLAATINSNGSTTLIYYDTAGRLIAKAQSEHYLSADELASLGDTPRLADLHALIDGSVADGIEAHYFDDQGREVASVVNGQFTTHITDAAGRPTTDVTYYSGVNLGWIYQDGQVTIPTLDDLTARAYNSQYDTRTYHFYDDQGQSLVDITSSRQYSGWDGYVTEPDITFHYTSQDGKVSEQVLYRQAWSAEQFQNFASDPTLDHLKAITLQGWGASPSVTVRDDSGRITLTQTPNNGLSTFSYDDTNGTVVERQWHYAALQLPTDGTVPDASDMLAELPDPSTAGTTITHVTRNDAAGAVTYDISSDGTVDITRRNTAGATVATAHYPNASQDDIDAVTAHPTPAALDTLLVNLSTPNALHVSDGSGNALAVFDGTTLTVTHRDTAGNVTGQTRYAHTPTDAELQALAASGDVATLVASMGHAPGDVSTISVRDAADNVLASVDLAGNVTTYRYDASGRLLLTVQHANRLTQTQRTALGDTPTLAAIQTMVGTSDNDTAVLTMRDPSGRLLASTDTNGQITFYVYDDQGRQVATTFNEAQVTARQLLELSDAPSLEALRFDIAVDNGDKLSQNLYDNAGRLVATIGADGVVVTQGYDAAGNVTLVHRYATSLKQGFGFFPTLEALRAELPGSPADSIEHSVYDAQGRLVASIGPQGYLTLTTYRIDGTSTLAAYAVPLTPTQLASLGVAPSLAQVMRMISGRASYDYYDPNGRRIASVDPADVTTYYFYDEAGRLSAQVDAAGVATSFDYDAAGHVVGTTAYATAVDVSAWRNATTGKPNPPSVFTPPVPADLDRTTYTVRDASGRVQASVDAVGTVTTFVYDGEGSVTASTIRATTISRSALASATLPLTMLEIDVLAPTSTADRTARSIRDAAGNLVAQIDAEGYVTAYTYDNLDNVTATRRYATRLDASALASLDADPSEATLGGLLSPTQDDLVTRSFRDGRGRVVASIDEAGYLTTYAFDEKANTTTTIRYAVALTADAMAGLADGASNDDLVALLPSTAGSQQTNDRFDSEGELVEHVDATGADTVYTYDADGRQVAWKTTDAWNSYSGKTAFDAFGGVVSRTTGTGDVTSSVWNASGQLESTTDAAGNTTRYYYNDLGRLSARLDGRQDANGHANALGAVTSYSYDSFGELESTTQYGNLLNLDYDGFNALAGTAATVVDAVKATGQGEDTSSTRTYDAAGRLAAITDGDGYTTRYAYDAFGELVSSSREVTQATTDAPTGQWDSTTYAYDARGERTTVTQAAGTTEARNETSTYDAFGRVLSSTDGMGQVTSYTYDRLGRQIAVADTVNGQLRHTGSTYDAFDRVLSQVDAMGHTTRFAYDTSNHAVTVTTPEGVSMTTVRDALGDVVSVSDGAGNITRYAYDGAGRLVERTDALGNEDSYSYSYADGGSVVHQTGADGDITTTYDARGKVLSRSVGTTVVQTTSYAYDGAGRVVTQTMPEGGQTRFAYDGAGNLVSQIDDTGVQTTYAYDGEGRQVRVTSGVGTEAVTTAYAYDALGRLASTTVDPDGFALTTSFRYDKDDRLIQSTDANGLSTWYIRDEAGRVTYTFTPVGAVADHTVRVTQSTYDLDGRLVSSTGGSSAVAASELDSLGSGSTADDAALGARLASQASGAADRTLSTVFDADGRKRFVVDADGLVTEWRYDALGRVTATLVYTSPLDRSGSLGAALATGTATVVDIGHALASAGDIEAQSHAAYSYYDANGNVLYTVTATESAGQRMYVVNGATYNPDGQLATATLYASALSQADFDQAVSSDAMASVLERTQDAGSTRTTTYLYDADHRQVAVTGPDGTTSFSVYDAVGNLSETVDPAGTVTTIAYDDMGRVTGRTVHANALDTSGWMAGGQLTYQYGGQPYNVAYDQRTDTTYDSAGRVSGTYAYSGVYPAGGEATLYHYDSAGRITAVDDASFEAPSPPSFAPAGSSTGVAGGYTFDEIRTTRYERDADGNIVAQLDPTGVLTTYTVDAEGRALASTTYATVVADRTAPLSSQVPAASADDRTTHWFRDARGNVTASIDASGYLTRFSYDAAGRETGSTRYATMVPASARVDQASALAAVEGGDSRSTSTTYDAQGRVSSTTDAEGTVTTYTYDLGGHVLTTTSAAGTSDAREVTSVYNALGQLVQTTDAAGATTAFTYDVNGRLATSTDALGDITWHVYDAVGREVFTIVGMAGADGSQNSYGAVTEHDYDAFGDVTRSTTYASYVAMDASFSSNPAYVSNLVSQSPYSNNEAQQTSYSYDARGHVTSSYDDSGEIEYTYDGFGELVQRQDERSGNHPLTSTFTYDADGRRISQYDAEISGSISGSGGFGAPLAASQSWTYDAFGDVASYTDADGSVVSYRYDPAGERTSSSQVVGGGVRAQSSTYDAYGRITTQTDALGLTTTFAYDDHARSVTTGLPGGLSTTTTHDRFGKTIALTDTTGATTLYGYDAAGRLRTTTRPDGLTSSSTYDVLGNLTSTTDAQGHVVTYTYDARGKVVSQSVDPDGLDLITTYAYDGVGREIRITDPVGNSTVLSYDGAGNVSSSEVDDRNGNMVTHSSYYYAGNHVTQTQTMSPTGYAYSYDSYDGFGHLMSSTSKTLGTTYYAYDSKGNLTESSVDGVSTYYFYDEAGELIYKVSPAGGSNQYSGYGIAQGPVMDSVTAYTYDKDGHVLSTTQYATTIEDGQLSLSSATPWQPSEASTLSQVDGLLPLIATSADDRTIYNVYDDNGRLAYQVDASGNVTETRYDAAGRIAATLRYPHSLAIDATLAQRMRAGTESVADMSARVAAAGDDESTSREVRTYYDIMGRVAFSMQVTMVHGTRTGRVTETRYDIDGHVVATIVHDALVSGATLDSLDTDALTAWSTTTSGGVSTQTAYDVAGRPTWQVAADGTVTQTVYDDAGHAIASSVYAHPLASTGDGSEASIAAAAALANPDPADVRTTQKVYDALGNVLQVFAPGDTNPTASYTYDAQNTLASYTNALGLTWTYQYQNGFLVSESTPSYAQFNLGGSGSVESTTQPLITNYSRDGEGRLTGQSMPNGSAGGQTYYQRDAAGNIVSTYVDATAIFDPTQARVVNNGNQALNQATYDAFGEQVVYTDAQGATSYKVYDASGRLAYDIDASGHVTAYSYDGFGEVSSVIRYAQPIVLSSIAGWIPDTPLDVAQVSSVIVTDAGDRQVTTTYDGFGRKTEVSQTAVAYTTADGQSGVARPTTRYRYDVRGNLIATEVLVAGDASQSTATWAVSRSYYDGAGRQVMTVDPMGYVSTWTYGDFGQLLTQTDYATPVAAQAFVGNDTPPALPVASNTDRSTTYTYDVQGRKLTESTLRDYVDANGQAVHGFVTTTYGYDAAGQVTSVSEGGRTIVTTYDEAGHIQSVTAPPERVLVSNWKDLLAANPTWDLTNDALYVTASQVVTYGYDGAGLKTVETHGSTAGGASLSTWYQYDGAGRQLATVTSVNGASPDWTSSRVAYNVYDLDGHLSQSVTQQTDAGFSGVAITVTKAYSYDATGNVTATTVSRAGATTPDTDSTSDYNGFGEVASTGNGVVTKSTSTYDAAGRLTTWTDPATGVLHTYSYDLAGHLVTDATQATGGAAVHIGYTRDLDGNVLSQVAPSTTDATGEGAPRQATYDRWGNVLSSTDAEGNTTTYTYNERNQLVSTSGPQVTVVDAAGNASTTSPVKTTAYDVDGNVVAVTDENGNTVRTVYDAAGQVVDVIDGAGSHTRVAYDTLGNEVGGQTGVDNGSDNSLHITFKEVDGQGRVVDEGDFFDDGTGYKATLRQVYVLDEAGHRVAVFDGLGSAALQAGDQATANRHATYYSYDSQGRVIASQNGAQRDFSHVDPANYPAPVQQPRNLNLTTGDVAWSIDPADQGGGWTYTNGTYVYAGGTDATIHLVNQDRVPVTAGQQITAWADLESDGSHGGSGVDIVWYDANDQLISRSGGNVQTTDDGRGRSTVTGTAPSGAAYARIDVGASNHGNSNNTTTFYGAGWDYTPADGGLSPILDGSIFVSLPTTTFSMQPLNPDFENGASGWDLTAGWNIVQADNTANGKWVATYTGTTVGTLVNNNRAPVVPGQKITAKARITLDQHNDGKPAGALLILWYDKDGNLVRYNSSSVITNGHDGTFQDVSVTDVAPEGAVYATVAFSGNGDGTGFAVFDAVSWDYHYVPTLNVSASVNTFTYDRDGNLTAQTNADGDSESWTRDTYGRITDHTDLSGATYHYTYDASSGLQLTESDNWAAGALADVTAPGYVHGASGTGSSESRSYNAAGQLVGLTYADGSAYSYAYDANGNQVRQEATTLDGNGKAVHTVTTTGYDSHGRIAQVSSDDGTDVLTETYTYDAAGNRRSIVATVTAGGVQKSSTTSWYDYDADNRVSVSDGDLVNGAITVAGRSTSYGSSYDAAGNLTVRMTQSGGTFMAQHNLYDARGELLRAHYASALGDPNAWRGIAETRTYDANGNVITDAQYYMKGTTATKAYNPKLDPDSPSYIGDGAGQTPGADISGYLSTATITRYDSYGRVAAEQTFGHGQNWNGTGGESTPDALPADGATSWSGMDLQSAVLYQGPGNSAGYDAMGNVVFYQYRANSARLDQYTVTYLKKEDYLESSTSGQNITNLANVRPTTDESYYNVRGERIAIAQHTQYAYGTVADTVRAFAFDGNGQIIARRDGTAKDNTIDQGSDPTLKNQHYVYVNGQQVAHYDEHSTVDVLSEVTAFSSGNGTGDYVVQDGDTLKSIAQAVYGNASLWYIVAQANALGGDGDLAAGLSLTIPAVTTTKNDATTFKPYNPSEIQGSTMPDLPVIAPPPPPPKHHCNVIAAVVVIAVVVVASVFTFGAAAAALGDIGAAALAGAAGSAAGQLAGDALGTHQGFSLGEVFTSAATAAATAGVGQWLGDTSAAATAAQAGADTAEGATAVSEASSWSVFGVKATEAAAGYVAQDAAAKLVGEPAHFSWAGLVSNSIAGGVAGLIGPTQQQVQAGQAAASPLRMGAAALAQGVVQREASRALGDDRTPSWEQIGEQAAGAALGSALSPSRQPSTQDTLSSWSRSGGGINAYSGLATDGTSYSLAGETQGSSGYAYLDNGSSLHPYDLTSYAATLASSPDIATSSGMRTTFDSGVGDSDVNWADRDHPTLLAGMSDSRAPMFSLTAQDSQTFGGLTVHANPAGVYDEHYDPVWAQQQAALSAQQSAMDAGNQQRLNDFFNDGALHIAAAPVYAAVGLGKELVYGAQFVATKAYAGMAFQAARSAEFGATVRGDEAGMASAEALQNRALADAAAPVTPLLHESEFEHTAAQAFGLINPEELAVSGISLADRLASGAPAVTDLAAGSYAARGSLRTDNELLDASDGANLSDWNTPRDNSTKAELTSGLHNTEAAADGSHYTSGRRIDQTYTANTESLSVGTGENLAYSEINSESDFHVGGERGISDPDASVQFASSVRGEFSLLNGETRSVSFDQFNDHIQSNGLSQAFSKNLYEIYDDVYAVPKALRPDPSTYLTSEFMADRLQLFDNGAGRIDSSADFDRFNAPRIMQDLPIGRSDGMFVSPKSFISRLFESGDSMKIERALGLPDGSIANNGGITAIYLNNPNSYGLRFATGREEGANSFWLPGTSTYNTRGGIGIPEMFVNPVYPPHIDKSVEIFR